MMMIGLDEARIALLARRASEIRLSLVVSEAGFLRISQGGSLLFQADAPRSAEIFLEQKERAVRFAQQTKDKRARIAALH